MNLGNPNEFTIRELAEGGDAELVYEPLPTDDPLQRQPDISLAQRALQWNPRVPLDEGLRRTVAYFRALLAA
jgi:UDP-glucuronate decarboxylase